MYLLAFSKDAEKDKKRLREAGLDGNAKRLLRILSENPFQNPPPYEKLVGDLRGMYSRRINVQHRIVYQVFQLPTEQNAKAYEGTVRILRMWTHYE